MHPVRSHRIDETLAHGSDCLHRFVSWRHRRLDRVERLPGNRVRDLGAQLYRPRILQAVCTRDHQPGAGCLRHHPGGVLACLRPIARNRCPHDRHRVRGHLTRCVQRRFPCPVLQNAHGDAHRVQRWRPPPRLPPQDRGDSDSRNGAGCENTPPPRPSPSGRPLPSPRARPRNHLQRHVAPQTRVPRPVHFPHPAGADPAAELVGAERLRRSRVRGSLPAVSSRTPSRSAAVARQATLRSQKQQGPAVPPKSFPSLGARRRAILPPPQVTPDPGQRLGVRPSGGWQARIQQRVRDLRR